MSKIRPLWNGVLSFGLVVIPVRLYAATQRKDITFHWLHKTCNSPIRYMKWCPSCEREVSMDEIVRAYEYEKGRYVIFTQEELDQFPAASPHRIEIMDFVHLQEVDPVYFEKSFFLEPQDGAEKAYAILLSAMESTKKVAVARVAVRAKETLALVRSYDSRLIMLETMFWADEVRSGEELFDPRTQHVDPKEMELAKTLIGALSAKFDASRYKNRQKEMMMELVEQKIQGKEIIEAFPEKAPVIDLMEALRKSIEKAQKRKGPARKKPRKEKEEVLQDASSSPPP